MTPKQFITDLLDRFEAFSSRQVDAPVVCLCVALDHWERLREQYGYSGLIKLLEEVEALLMAECESDAAACTLNERCVLVRLSPPSVEAAQKQAEKLFGLIGQELVAVGDERIALSISLCFSEFDHRFTSADQLLVNLIKHTEGFSAAGGNGVKHIRPNVSAVQASASDQQMLGLLMESLRKNAVKVMFQPLMATTDDASKSFQVLPRVPSSDGSLIPASQFIPVAREAGVLALLDRWMLQQTIRLLVEEYRTQPVRLFLTQGDSLLVSSERREWLCGLMEKHPQASGKLVLDFSFEDALTHLKAAHEFLSVAAKLGIGVCLSRVDEFSKWNLLKDRLRVDYIKMSPGFVRRLGQDGTLAGQFQRISDTVRQQGTRIIVPMVEDATVAANLWRIGADYMQGYMIEKETDTPHLGD